MIDYNDLRVRQGLGSEGRVQTLNGSITIEEGAGRMVIRDAVTNNEIQVHDSAGSRYNNDSGETLTSINTQGVTVGTPAERRARLGYHPDGQRINVWVSPEGTDVIELLESEI